MELDHLYKFLLKAASSSTLEVENIVGYYNIAVLRLEEGGVRASWYVNTKHDVADFKLIVRNTSTSDLGESKKLLWEKLEHYNTRSDSFFTLPKNKVGAFISDLEILPCL